jgi:hypothetical protein
MRVPSFATFESAFPDDSVEEGGDIVVPGGENILRAINDFLGARGYHLSNFEQHSHYGWSFDLRGKEGNFWFLVQHPGPWLLTVHDSRMVWSRVFGGQADFAALIDQCRACLESIPQLSSIQWLSRREYEAQFHDKQPKNKNA